MSSFLKQSTAGQIRTLGPFVDDTDFKTAETGLTIANTDVKVIVNGGASANKNSGGGTHRMNGMYGFTFDATDTATVGEIDVSIVVAGALPVFKTFTVVEEVVYDALFAASAPGFVSLDAAGIRTAVGLASANVDTQLDALPTAAEITTAVLAGASANPIDANVQEVNDVALQGVGTVGNAWRPA